MASPAPVARVPIKSQTALHVCRGFLRLTEGKPRAADIRIDRRRLAGLRFWSAQREAFFVAGDRLPPGIPPQGDVPKIEDGAGLVRPVAECVEKHARLLCCGAREFVFALAKVRGGKIQRGFRERLAIPLRAGERFRLGRIFHRCHRIVRAEDKAEIDQQHHPPGPLRRARELGPEFARLISPCPRRHAAAEENQHGKRPTQNGDRGSWKGRNHLLLRESADWSFQGGTGEELVLAKPRGLGLR